MEVTATARTCRKTMREMIDLNLRTLFLLRDNVADAADGVHLDAGAALGELLAQAVDIDLDRVGGDLAGMAEDMVLDLLLGDDAALAAHQKLQHRGLARGQHLRLVVDRGLPVLRIEGEVGDAQARAAQLGPPAPAGPP